MALQHLFFDLDHTLWDFDKNSDETLLHLYDTYNLAQQLKVPPEQFIAIYNKHNEKLWARFRKGFINRKDLRIKRFWLTLTACKCYNLDLASKLSQHYLEILPTQTRLVEGAEDIVDYCCSKGYQLHILSNGFYDTQIQKLENVGLRTFFQHIITSETAFSIKPSKAIFDYAQKSVNASLEEVIMIGDNYEVDVLGAKNAGWQQIFYNPKAQAHEATYAVEKLVHIKNIL